VDARFGGEPRKLLPLAPPANATALPPLTLVAGADVAPGDIAHPEGCDPVGNATLPGGRTQYAYSCGADAVGFGRYARSFFAVSQGDNHHIDPNTGSSEPRLVEPAHMNHVLALRGKIRSGATGVRLHARIEAPQL
jgi:hypothetical protein